MTYLLMSIGSVYSYVLYLYLVYGDTVPIFTVGIFALNAILVLQHGMGWLSGKMDSFDPLGLFGLFGLVYFLISPVNQISNDFWPFMPKLTNDITWINIWGLMNLAGILVYLVFSNPPIPQTYSGTAVWTIRPRRFRVVVLYALLFCGAMQLVVFSQFGGIGGFIQTFTQRQQLGLGLSDSDPFEDLGLPMLFAESFKYVFAMACVIYFRDKPYAKSAAFFISLMLLFLAVFFVFGGLRGSRSSTLFSLVFAAGMYHFWIKPIRVRMVLLGIAFTLVFVNGYYWYKIAGTDGITAIFDTEARGSYNADRQDSNLYVFSRDLGRMDVQTLAMRQFEQDDMDYVLGLTYLTSIFTVIPTSIVPEKPTYLNETKTEIVRGKGRYVDTGVRQTTILLGLFGEAFINFGYPGVLAAFAVFGWLVRKIRILVYSLHPNDARRLLLPVLCLLPINILLSDAGLIVLLLARNLMVPVVVLLLSAEMVRTNQKAYGNEALVSA